MNEKFEFDRQSDNHGNYLINDNFCLTEEDFYPPSDNRVWTSKVADIGGGDNFADYCKYIYRILDEEDYFEN